MSNVSEEGVAAVKNLACDKLLQVASCMAWHGMACHGHLI